MTYNTHNKRHNRIAVTFSCLKSQPVTTTTTEPNKSTQDIFGFSLGILVGVPITLTVLKRKLIAENLKNFRKQEK